MASAAQAFKSYRSAEVATVTQRDLVVKLVEGAARFLREAQACMRNHEYLGSVERCAKARRIIVELLSTLNFEQGGEVALQLKSLYLFLIQEISRISLTKDADAVDKVLPILQPLIDAWKGIPEEFANVTSLEATGKQSTFSVRT